MTHEALLPVQHRVRQHVLALLPMFERDQEAACRALGEALAADPQIVRDPLLNTDLRRPVYSQCYLDLIYKNALPVPADRAVQLQAIQPYIVNRDPLLQPSPLPLYTGGSNPQATFRHLFQLARGDTLPVAGGQAVYASALGLVETWTDGTHRTQACVMWGHPRLYLADLRVTDVPFDPEVERRFRFLEAEVPWLLGTWVAHLQRYDQAHADDVAELVQARARRRDVWHAVRRLGSSQAFPRSYRALGAGAFALMEVFDTVRAFRDGEPVPIRNEEWLRLFRGIRIRRRFTRWFRLP